MLTDFIPTVPLAFLPTPLVELQNLRKVLKESSSGFVPQIWIKRDDCTGLAGGGNKTRKLEYLIADALEQECDCVITAGGVQSNHCRQTVAAAARYNLECHLVLVENVDWNGEGYQTVGNLQLDSMMGARITVHPKGSDRDHLMKRKAAELRAAGRKPFIIPVGGSNSTGAMGYAAAYLELLEQTKAMGIHPRALYHCTSSGGTQAGLVAGFIAAKRPFPVIGIDNEDNVEGIKAVVDAMVPATLERLGWFATVDEDDVQVLGGYGGPAYGIPNEGTIAAVDLLAKTEGILMDPVYSGKAMAALIDHIRKGIYREEDIVVFLHTGGAQVLSAYQSSFETHFNRA
ncbi:D-cysteine desulfhydrase family protein [Kiloniella sp. b19]|uniref:D-cysteine desulfhydrase family protein n=1 Tax=Kiloniella sp. GXU_MW_B19 TaxID=3141326 RepID=UPI0031CF948A